MGKDYQALIQQIHSAIDNDRLRLPSFPENLMKIREALNDPDVSVRRLAQLIHTDPVLASRIYAIANSAAFGINTDSSSLLHVMQKLGMNMVRNAIYNFCLSQLFSDRRFIRIQEVATFVRNRSLEVAGVTHALSKRYSIEDPAVALLAGLFHNVGALVILGWLAQNPSKCPDKQDQKALILVGQIQFSRRVVETWRIPDALKRVIAADQESLKTHDDANRYVHLLEIALWVIRILRNTKTIEQPPSSSLALFNLDVDDLLKDKDEIMADMIKIIQAIR